MIRGHSFMTSATLGGGGEPNSDILLTHADGGGGMPEVADKKLYFGREKK